VLIRSEKGEIEVVSKLGDGKYSNVYDGIDPNSGKRVVIKILKPIRDSKILREIKILETLQGGANIIKLLKKCYDDKNEITILVKT
jgi:casein kinase II subunit alpha